MESRVEPGPICRLKIIKNFGHVADLVYLAIKPGFPTGERMRLFGFLSPLSSLETPPQSVICFSVGIAILFPIRRRGNGQGKRISRIVEESFAKLVKINRDNFPAF